MTREQLALIAQSTALAMKMFTDACAAYNQALHLGQDSEGARQFAHDSLDAYFNNLAALHGAKNG